MGWRVTVGGVTYQGRPVSAEAIRTFQRAVAAAGSDVVAQTAALKTILRLAFPLSWGILWKGDPVRKILALDDVDRAAVLTDFFASLRSPSNPNGNRMNGTGSRPPIVTR